MSEPNTHRLPVTVIVITHNSAGLVGPVLEALFDDPAGPDEVIVVVDSTKFGRTSLVHLCGLGDIDIMVVDNEISEDWRSKMIAVGVELVVTGPTDNA